MGCTGDTRCIILCTRAYVGAKALGAQSFPTAVTASQTQALPVNRYQLARMLSLLLQQGWLNARAMQHCTLGIHGLRIVLPLHLSYASVYIYACLQSHNTLTYIHVHVHMAFVHTQHFHIRISTYRVVHKYCMCIYLCAGVAVCLYALWQHSSQQQDTGH